MNTSGSIKERSFNIPIAIVSILIPLVVFYIFYLTPPQVSPGFDLRILPAINASLNFSTALLLLLGRYFIYKKQIRLHRNTMIVAFALSSLFLISYVTYHTLTNPTSYGGAGVLRPIYFTILITHIILAALIVPMILFTMTRGLQERYDKHRAIAKWTWPLWLYVAVTGVIVYLMLSPYYS